MTKAFKVFATRDVKETNKPLRAFIDVTDIFTKKESEYSCYKLSILLARTSAAMASLTYYSVNNRYQNNSVIINSGALCYAKMFTHIIDYLFKISVVETSRSNCMYYASKFYMISLMKKENNDSTKAVAMKIANISSAQADILEMYEEKDSYNNIKEFIDMIRTAMKLHKLQLDVFVEKWVYIFGSGTQLGMEFFPSFAEMVLYVYGNSFLNSQKVIEKVLGDDISGFSNALITGAETEFFR